MFDELRYVQTNFSAIFQRQPLIRRKSNDFEDILQSKYSQPKIVDIPDDLEPELPRIIFTSKYNQIVISQVSITLVVTFSSDWQRDVNKCRQYLIKHIPFVFRLINKINDTSIFFSGISTQAHLKSNASDQDILNHLSNIFFKENMMENPHDIEIKTTDILEERYFSNITISNYRLFEDDITRLKPAPNSVAHERGIRVFSDFNDRYSFNQNLDYQSSKDNFEQILDGGFNAIEAASVHIKGE